MQNQHLFGHMTFTVLINCTLLTVLAGTKLYKNSSQLLTGFVACNGNCTVAVALCSTVELVAAYRESCKQMGVKPLNKLVQQLEV